MSGHARICIYLSSQNARAIRQKAKLSGMSLSRYLAGLAGDQKITPNVHAYVITALSSFARHARKAVDGGDGTEQEALLLALDRCESLLIELQHERDQPSDLLERPKSA